MSSGLSRVSPQVVGGFWVVGAGGSLPAGDVVFGEDGVRGRVSVAVLSAGAASDASAVERFAAAVRVHPGPVWCGRTWAAVPWPGDAGVFLRAVWSPGEGPARGPVLEPYWAASAVLAGDGWGGDVAVAAGGRRWWPLVGLLLVVAGLLLGVLLSCGVRPAGPSNVPAPQVTPEPSVSRSPMQEPLPGFGGGAGSA